MSVRQVLNGWNVGVEKMKVAEPGENGVPQERDGFRFVFTEVAPPTGNQIVFQCSKEVADFVVSQITGIVIPGMTIPKL